MAFLICPRMRNLRLLSLQKLVWVKNMQREERGTSKEGIKKIAQKVWRQITPEYLESLYQSMPRRMQAVVDAQRGHTRY